MSKSANSLCDVLDRSRLPALDGLRAVAVFDLQNQLRAGGQAGRADHRVEGVVFASDTNRRIFHGLLDDARHGQHTAVLEAEGAVPAVGEGLGGSVADALILAGQRRAGPFRRLRDARAGRYGRRGGAPA